MSSSSCLFSLLDWEMRCFISLRIRVLLVEGASSLDAPISILKRRDVVLIVERMWTYWKRTRELIWLLISLLIQTSERHFISHTNVYWKRENKQTVNRGVACRSAERHYWSVDCRDEHEQAELWFLANESGTVYFSRNTRVNVMVFIRIISNPYRKVPTIVLWKRQLVVVHRQQHHRSQV